jgi:phage shock protein PspC (stress-responsive transcriptional regulator)
MAIGGVCSGLAAYFGIENWLMRLLWVILFFATGGGLMFILYIVLWIAVPKAVTAAEKLEMRGEKVTVSNIEKTVKEEYETVKENVKEGYHKVRQSDGMKKTKNVLDEIFHAIGQFILIILKVILFAVGFALIIGGLVTLIGLSIGFFFSSTIFPVHFFGSDFNSFTEMFGVFGDPANLTLISIALFFTFFIPLIALIYAGIKMIFRFKANDKMIGLTALVLWILSLVFLLTMAAFEGWNFVDHGRSSKTFGLNEFPSDTLVIRINENPGITGFSDEWYYRYDDDWHTLSTHERVYGKIDLNIQPGDPDDWELTVRKESQGRNDSESVMNAAMLDYNWVQESSELILDPYFSLLKPAKWRAPGTEVSVRIPVGKYVRLDSNTRYFLHRVKSRDELWKHEMSGEIWEMTEEGIVGVD